MTPTSAPTATEFRDITGHPGYQSDRQGNVRRQSRDGHFPQRIPGGWKYLTGTVQKRGCRVYCLPTNNKRFYLTDRQAVLKAFGETWPRDSYIYRMPPEEHANPGERNGNHRLTEDEVRDIRQMYSTGDWTQRELAEQFNVSQGNVAFIIKNKTWRHIL